MSWAETTRSTLSYLLPIITSKCNLHTIDIWLGKLDPLNPLLVLRFTVPSVGLYKQDKFYQYTVTCIVRYSQVFKSFTMIPKGDHIFYSLMEYAWVIIILLRYPSLIMSSKMWSLVGIERWVICTHMFFSWSIIYICTFPSVLLNCMSPQNPNPCKHNLRALSFFYYMIQMYFILSV